MRVALGHLGATFLSVWLTWATISIQFAILIFTMNFNDFTPLEVRTNRRFLGHSVLTLRPLLGNFAQLGTNLNIWSFGPFTKNTYFAANIRSTWGLLWGHLRITLGSFEYMRVALGHLGATFLSFWPKWATDVIQFAKNLHLYNEF